MSCRRTPLSIRSSASEVTLSGLVGGEYLPLPGEFGYCRYPVLQCCGFEDVITLRDKAVLLNLLLSGARPVVR